MNRFQFIAPQPLFLSPPFFPPNHAYLGRLALVLELGHRFYNRNFGDITSALGTSVYEDHPHHDTALTRERGVSAHALLVLTSVLPRAVEIIVNSTSSFSFIFIPNDTHDAYILLHFLHLRGSCILARHLSPSKFLVDYLQRQLCTMLQLFNIGGPRYLTGNFRQMVCTGHDEDGRKKLLKVSGFICCNNLSCLL